MTQSAYSIQVSAALQRIASRYPDATIQDLNPQDGDCPKYINDYVNKVAADAQQISSTGPKKVIDVIPDFRHIINFISYYITRDYPEINARSDPTLTPTSLAGYLLATVYTAALIYDDTNIRYNKSIYSKDFATDTNLQQCIGTLRNLVVPPFMLQLFEGLTPSTDDRMPFLRFVFTLACYNYKHDFGKAFPISMFFTASQLIATSPTNMQPSEIISAWLNTALTTNPQTNPIFQQIGVIPDNLLQGNWFSDIIFQLFNPVTSRTNTVRPTLNTMRFRPQDLPQDIENLNPYQYLLCLDKLNRKTTLNVLQNISKSMSVHYGTKTTIGELLLKLESKEILNHYYQNILPPTFHKISLSTLKESSTTTANDLISIGMFMKPEKKQTATALTFPSAAEEHYEALYLAKNTKFDDKTDPIARLTYDPEYPPTDRIRHFCPNDPRSEIIYRNIIKGVYIETAELDSVAVPHPDPRNTVIDENSFFLDSAIPMSHIMPLVLTGTDGYDIVMRARRTEDAQAVRIDLLDRAIDRLPQFGPLLETALPDTLPGYTQIANLQEAQFGCNSLCYTLQPNASPVIPTGIRKVKAWSSYRYFNATAFNPANINDVKLMILNFRTLFGTNVTLQETDHPSVLIPLS